MYGYVLLCRAVYGYVWLYSSILWLCEWVSEWVSENNYSSRPHVFWIDNPLRLCRAMYGYVWLWRAMKGYVGLCRTMYGCVWLSRAMYGYVWLKRAMLWLCESVSEWVSEWKLYLPKVILSNNFNLHKASVLLKSRALFNLHKDMDIYLTKKKKKKN